MCVRESRQVARGGPRDAARRDVKHDAWNGGAPRTGRLEVLLQLIDAGLDGPLDPELVKALEDAIRGNETALRAFLLG